MGRKAVAVIGGGYGDEGKGLMTDYWASQLDNPTVIRFNGGCQAGHTVTTPDGNRNVFSHFGSGTFVDAPTYLSKFFVVNPRLFREEHTKFVATYGFAPKIYADQYCLTTTPIEMLINQWLEVQRGDERHGSVGVGFGETLERVKRTHKLFCIWYVCNVSTQSLRMDLTDLIKKYLPLRIEPGRRLWQIVNNQKLIDDFIEDVAYFREHVTITTAWHHLHDGDVVFEGAQGLELDQDYGVFPHVTRSNCGMRNVSELIDECNLNLDKLNVNYVTRAYKTRHGEGPFPHDYETRFPYTDATNVYNDWQGGLRWGKFDYADYRSITDKDFALYAREHNPDYKVNRLDTVTCVNQIPLENSEFMREFWEANHPYQFHFSWGPTRDDMEAN